MPNSKASSLVTVKLPRRLICYICENEAEYLMSNGCPRVRDPAKALAWYRNGGRAQIVEDHESCGKDPGLYLLDPAADTIETLLRQLPPQRRKRRRRT